MESKEEKRMRPFADNIRPNLAGDFPKIHPSSLIDPSAQIIGNVRIAQDVFVGPLTVIRADQRGADDKVEPIVIEEEVNIQDGVIIHSEPGKGVVLGARTSVAHGVTIHGPCRIGQYCFLAMRSTVYSVTFEDNVWLGMGATAMRVTLPSYTMVPAGGVIRGYPDAFGLRLVTDEEKEYMDQVLRENSRLRRDYLELLKRAESIKSSAEERVTKKS
ncbi:MAG: carbonate dehydratase [Deltaproteobacteria bacterium HGW-Deltaproteobacteria-21]|nr:MAG: carbonate dehydratase [Deltaproteobacteria bacterium HGW-Deltaproteobacteria-21]